MVLPILFTVMVVYVKKSFDPLPLKVKKLIPYSNKEKYGEGNPDA